MPLPELNPARAFAGESLLVDFGDGEGERIYKLNDNGVAVEWRKTND